MVKFHFYLLWNNQIEKYLFLPKDYFTERNNVSEKKRLLEKIMVIRKEMFI